MAEYITDFHGCEEILKKGETEAVLWLSKQGKRIALLKKMAEVKGFKVKNVTPEELDKLCKEENRGFVLQVKGTAHNKAVKKSVHFEDFLDNFDKEDALVVVLDGITDPHNYGAILRSCDQFNADLVVIPSRRSASETPVVARVSAGAVSWVQVSVVPNLARALKQLKKAGFWIYGADMGGKTADKLNLKGRTAIVMGSEGKGLSRIVKENCDCAVSIPTQGHVDSLNVSVAAGILMYEVKRQQN